MRRMFKFDRKKRRWVTGWDAKYTEEKKKEGIDLEGGGGEAENEKTADTPPVWFSREISSEERAQKFHIDGDVSLPRSASDWMKENFNQRPIRSTTQIWVVIRD